MITTEEKALAQWAMEQALKGGCDGCRVSLSQGQESSIELRNEQIDKWTQSNERQMVIALYTNDRYGSVSTNRLERDELERFIKEAITSTQLLEPDPDRQLPDPALCYHGGGVDLKQYDEEFPYIGMDEKLACAKAIIEEMCDQVPNIISMESSYSDLEAYNYLINSQGFESELRGTNYGLSAVVSLMDSDEARPEAFWYDSAIRWDALN